MRKNAIKILAGALCTALVVGTTSAVTGVFADKDVTVNKELTSSAATTVDTESIKNQVVYAFTAADGSVKKLVVSDWIKANGSDLYSKYESEGSLPVGLEVKYLLDGQELTAGELAGKSGRVTIRFNYTNNEYEMKDINGKQERIYVPFTAVSGMLLDNDKFSNVSITNGKLINDGSRTVAAGLAFPGMQESLGLEADVLELPSYFEISADVKDYEPLTMYTLYANASLGSLGDLDDKLGEGLDLDDKLAELTSAMTQLTDGSRALYQGLEDLLTGAGSLSEGIAQLSAGLNTLAANNAALTQGSEQVFNSLLDMATKQLKAAGLEVPALTISNYSAVLDEAMKSLAPEVVEKLAKDQVTAAVEANKAQIKAAVTEAVSAQVRPQVEAAVTEAVKAQVEAQVKAAVLAQLPAETPGIDQIIAAKAAEQMETEDIKALIASNTDAKLAEQLKTAEIKAIITAKTDEQAALLIEENLKSDAVKEKLAAAAAGLESLKGLKVSLNSYAEFYYGLAAYTDGVATAAAGAGQLDAATPQLMNGIEQLRDGALALSDGLGQFNEQVVDKLVNLVTGDITIYADRLKAINEVSSNYSSFTGLGQGEKSSVKFIVKTN